MQQKLGNSEVLPFQKTAKHSHITKQREIRTRPTFQFVELKQSYEGV